MQKYHNYIKEGSDIYYKLFYILKEVRILNKGGQYVEKQIFINAEQGLRVEKDITDQVMFLLLFLACLQNAI